MSRMVTRPELRTMALRRADVEAETDETNGRFPLTEINEELNRSLASYHSMLVGLRGADFYEKRYFTLAPVTKSNGAAPNLFLAGVPVYEMPSIVITVLNGGPAPAATFWVVIKDAYGNTIYESIVDPAAGVELEIAGTGLRLTAAAGTYIVNDTYTSKTQPWKTSPGVGSYILPEDFFQLTLVETKISGVYVPIERFNRNQRPWLRAANTWYGYDSLPMYRLRGDGRYKNTQLIEFSPTPSAVYEVDLWYIPQAPAYTADTGGSPYAHGTWELPFDSGGEEWVACDVAQKLLLKDNLDPSFVLHRKGQIEEMIKQTFSARDAAMPERVVDRSESFGLGAWPWR